MLEAAMPVLAVTETTSGLRTCFFLSAMMMALRSKDFPVPAKDSGITINTNSHRHEKKKNEIKTFRETGSGKISFANEC
jgi:hypothetical protein